MAVSSFRKALHRGYLKGFTIWLELEIGIIPGFWICQGYTMEILVFTQVSEYPWICLNNSWIMPEYTVICQNQPQWLNFAFPHTTSLSAWTHGYFFQSLHETRGYSLNENEGAFCRDWFLYRRWKYLLFLFLIK